MVSSWCYQHWDLDCGLEILNTCRVWWFHLVLPTLRSGMWSAGLMVSSCGTNTGIWNVVCRSDGFIFCYQHWDLECGLQVWWFHLVLPTLGSGMWSAGLMVSSFVTNTEIWNVVCRSDGFILCYQHWDLECGLQVWWFHLLLPTLRSGMWSAGLMVSSFVTNTEIWNVVCRSDGFILCYQHWDLDGSLEILNTAVSDGFIFCYQHWNLDCGLGILNTAMSDGFILCYQHWDLECGLQVWWFHLLLPTLRSGMWSAGLMVSSCVTNTGIWNVVCRSDGFILCYQHWDLECGLQVWWFHLVLPTLRSGMWSAGLMV